MPRSLVTGGAGFIGSNLVHQLVRSGHEVIVIDNLSTGKRANLAELDESIRFIEGDIRDPELVREATQGVQYLFHQAALPSVARSVREPWQSHDHNSSGTLNVLLAARDAGVERVVYAASSSAYGDTAVLPKSEALPPNPLSPYAVTKYTGELYCRVFYQLYGLETVALRYFNVFGPRQDPLSEYAAVIPRFITGLLSGEAPVIYGDGEQTRDFTYVDNVVQANLLAAIAPGEKAAGRVFNIGSGRRISLLELLAMLKQITGIEVEPRHADARPGDVRDSLAEIARARGALGYVPTIEFEDGLTRTVAWFVDQQGVALRTRHLGVSGPCHTPLA